MDALNKRIMKRTITQLIRDADLLMTALAANPNCQTTKIAFTLTKHELRKKKQRMELMTEKINKATQAIDSVLEQRVKSNVIYVDFGKKAA